MMHHIFIVTFPPIKLIRFLKFTHAKEKEQCNIDLFHSKDEVSSLRLFHFAESVPFIVRAVRDRRAAFLQWKIALRRQ